MNEHINPNDFEGDAISRADREFLASLSDHPLARHPLYGVPCPPCPAQPSIGDLKAESDAQRAARAEAFATAVDWMLVNYAYYKSAFVGRGGVISLVDGEIISVAGLRGFMEPFAILSIGPKGGIKTTSLVSVWMMQMQRLQIDAIQMRPDRPRPTFMEEGRHIFNRYRPPAHPTEGGDIAVFESFFARLIPDEVERTWMWNWLSHKARRPWVPMVAVIALAEQFGSGRGTMFDILELLFGNDYVVPCTFGELTGTSGAARFNARLGDALFVVVGEAVAEDGHQQTQRRLQYDALKNVVDPSPTQRRRFEEKNQRAYAQKSAASTIIATNHRDVVKLPRDDRRFEVITCGRKMTGEETTEIRTWMADPKNIGALLRALLATPAVPREVFDPYGVPPPFAGRLEMIGMAKSRMEDAYEAMLNALGDYPLFTMTQAKRVIGCFGDYTSGDWANQALHTIAKNAYRLQEGRIRYRKRREIVYARTKTDWLRWQPADKEMIVAALDRTEKRVVRIINSGQIDIEKHLNELRCASDEGENEE